MNDIICPHCGKAFKIDEAGYADIVKQVRDADFEKQLHERLELAERDKQNAVELAQAKVTSELQKASSAKDAEIQALKARLDAGEVAQKLAVSEALSAVEKDRDALANALDALRPQAQARGGRLWCVFGCGGDRDRGKRPLMGQVAELHADHVIITADNPRSENVLSICDDIAAGMSPDASYTIEPERQSAIKLALISAQAGDVVLIAGKGHETVQIIGSEHRQYDERAYLRQLVTEMSA